ncbi:MAG TPA: ThuA domain-containing protein [Chloroflexota bacterium]
MRAVLLAVVVAVLPSSRAQQEVDVLAPPAAYRVLVFTRTQGFRHDSIPDAVTALTALGNEHAFAVDATEDPAFFSEAILPGYSAVAFVLTTGDVLNDDQQVAFEGYIRAGGGFVGVHSATDTEYDWPWYGGLVGAYFADHPPGTYRATVRVEDATQPATRLLPETWLRTDEWYNFRSNPRLASDVHVLATVDESTYPGGTMGDHPVAWFHAYDGGRAWYTAGGHTAESYHDPIFMAHLLGGLEYAANAVPTET